MSLISGVQAIMKQSLYLAKTYIMQKVSSPAYILLIICQDIKKKTYMRLHGALPINVLFKVNPESVL